MNSELLPVPGTRLKIDDRLLPGHRTLLLSGGWEDDFVQVMKDYALTAVSLNFSHGWDGDMSFLPTLPVAGVHVLASRPLTQLVLPASVRHLYVDAEFSSDATISGSPALEELRASWHPALVDIIGAAAQLRCMALWHVRDGDLGGIFGLRDPDALDELELIQAAIDSTRQLVDVMPPVRRLTLSHLRRCRDYSLHAPWLRHLELDHCRAFNDLTNLSAVLPSLSELILSNCGRVRSLSPLESARALRVVRLLGDTTVDDGDLVPLLDPSFHSVSVTRWARHYPSKADFLASAPLEVEMLV